MNIYCIDEINTLVIISLLKKHSIKKIIASPGTTNISFVGSVQFAPFFEVYSAYDERVASFMACVYINSTYEADSLIEKALKGLGDVSFGIYLNINNNDFKLSFRRTSFSDIDDYNYCTLIYLCACWKGNSGKESGKIFGVVIMRYIQIH